MLVEMIGDDEDKRQTESSVKKVGETGELQREKEGGFEENSREREKTERRRSGKRKLQRK